jgi:hypothetical protein
MASGFPVSGSSANTSTKWNGILRRWAVIGLPSGNVIA